MRRARSSSWIGRGKRGWIPGKTELPTFPSPLSCRRDLKNQLFFDRLEIQWLEHFFELRVFRDLVPHARVESCDQLQRLRHLFLETQPHLKRHLFAQLGDRRLTLLRQQHEDREEDRLERHDHREQTEGK